MPYSAHSHTRLFALLSGVFFATLGCASLAQSPAPQKSMSAVDFRNAGPVVASTATTVNMSSISTVGESQDEMDGLSTQKDTVESELRYAKAKLQAAQKNLDLDSMTGHAGQADKLQEEVNDWQARVKDLQAQLSEVNNEVQGAIQELHPAPPTDNIILPGDNLEVYVVEDASFNGRYQVRRGGYIIMPAVGRIAVAGKTLSEAEMEVRKALESSQLQHASVMVEKVDGSDIETGPVIYLAGEFKTPRPFRIPTGTKATVVSVILSCGGVTDKADLTRVKVMRVVANKSVVEEENVERILDGSGLTSDLTLSNGDVLMIPAGSANVIYITGRVAHPGTLPMKPGDKITVYAAILNCGGFGRFADLRKVYVLRASPDGTKVKIPVDIVAIQHGHIPDLPLEGDDIIIVPEKFFSF
ncbi:MAG TPA: SLBB domain-containing protein [Chthoniobacteraceae bacterium]|jgi:protein involved in polysaccharide export with SLBB domain|nr:SLBB domain-containing protein [Chthoniobacteraceae bacterium]